MSARRWCLRGLVMLAGMALLAAGSAVAYGLYLSASLALPTGDEHPPRLIYGAPFLLKPELDIASSHLIERLTRLGYQAVETAVRAPGEYRVTPAEIDIYLHEFSDLHLRPIPARLVLEQGRVARVLSIHTGDELFPAYLEPQLISGLRGASRQVREWVSYDDLSPRFLDILLAIEDRRFFSHPGIDPIAVGRAVWTNVTRGTVIQGGSTITQQLAKNLFYSPQRTFGRKLKESIAALVLEAKYRKQAILESYANEIYLGQVGSVSIYGVGQAAHRYFGKRVDTLSLEEAALLVGMIKGPNTYSPLRNPDLAKQRRDIVLGRLHEQGLINDEVWARAVTTPVQVMPPQDTLADAPFFVDYLLRQVEEATGAPLSDGVRAYTTLDPVLQRLATQTLDSELTRLETAYPALKGHPTAVQGALVAIDPKTGGILAMVGSRDYRASQFNRAVQAKRQPGSLFKPLVYLAALESRRELTGGPPLSRRGVPPAGGTRRRPADRGAMALRWRSGSPPPRCPTRFRGRAPRRPRSGGPTRRRADARRVRCGRGGRTPACRCGPYGWRWPEDRGDSGAPAGGPALHPCAAYRPPRAPGGRGCQRRRTPGGTTPTGAAWRGQGARMPRARPRCRPPALGTGRAGWCLGVGGSPWSGPASKGWAPTCRIRGPRAIGFGAILSSADRAPGGPDPWQADLGAFPPARCPV